MPILKPLISASILSADFARLGEDVTNVLKAGADSIHIDVMDQHYVPNLSFGPLIVEALCKYGIKAPMDVHLMVEPVDQMIIDFATTGVRSITFHPEASRHIDRSLSLIKSYHIQAGLALNPATPIESLSYVWDKLDRLLVMSVNPGFGGQQFIAGSLAKIQILRQMIDKINTNIILEVDGGINFKTIKAAFQAGAEMFVVGSALFKQADSYPATIATLKALCQS